MTPKEAVHKLNEFVFRKLKGCRPQPTTRRHAMPDGPGLLTTKEVVGVPLRIAMLPHTKRDHHERLVAVDLIPSLLDGNGVKDRAQRQIVSLVGRQTASFIVSGETPEERYALMLWAFANCPGVGYTLNREDCTLLLHDGDVTYGIERGVMVGGPLHGATVRPPLHELLAVESKMRIARQLINDCDLALRGGRGQEFVDARAAFLALFQRSKWDKGSMFSSLLLAQIYTKKRFSANEIATKVMDSDQPYHTLCKMLVGRCMTPRDFNELFKGQGGDPEVAKSLKYRIALVNKVYTLPFLQK